MQSISTLLAAGALALSASFLSPPALSADPHSHGHDAAPAKLQLNQGTKWPTDEPLRKSMATIREAGIDFVGMSSVGPTIAVITERSRKELEQAIADLGLKVAVETKIDNRGMTFGER